MINKIIAVDFRVNEFSAALLNSKLSSVFETLTILGSGIFCWMLYAIFIFFRMTSYSFLLTIISAEIVMLLVVIVLRHLVKRERPLPDIKHRLFMNWNRYSFPSLHAARVFMLTFITSGFYHKITLPMLLLAMVISFSRIYLKRHFLSDVIAGAIVGTGSGAIAYCCCPVIFFVIMR